MKIPMIMMTGGLCSQDPLLAVEAFEKEHQGFTLRILSYLPVASCSCITAVDEPLLDGFLAFREDRS